MSKLNDLINKFCPHGVEYVKLGDIATASKGKQLNKSNLLSDGKYAVINGGVKPTGYWNEYNYSSNRITVSQGGSCGFVDFQNNPFWAGAHCYVIVDESSSINYKFLYYILKNKEPKLMKLKHGAGIPSLAKSIVENLTIPLPPFPVQEEIVKILDKFTDLENELENELRMRKMQFNAYRDKLLTFDNGVKFEKLGDIANIVRGASPRPISSFITSDECGVNWIKIGDVSTEAKYVTSCNERITVEGSEKSRKVKPGDFILSNSMSFGRPYILKIDGCIHDGWIAISDLKYVTPDYLYYVLTSNSLQSVMRKKASFGGAVQNLNANTVRSLEIPVPPLEKQKEIVEKLDKFNDMCNEISEGLPLEIELRKKQKKYILNKLLNL